jgi:hypothetical protein
MSAVSATIQSTGEVLEFELDTLDQLIQSYKVLNEYAKALDGIKKQLQSRAVELADGRNFVESGDFGIRISSVQRTTYDKAVLRQVLDEDTLDLMLEPSKAKVDAYLKLHLDDLGADSTRIREALVPVGSAYQVVKLERLTR